MVEVDGDLLGRDFYDGAIEAVAISVLQGNNGTHEDVLLVDFPVYLENAGRQRLHAFFKMRTIGLFGLQREGELIALVQVCHCRLEIIECHAHPADKLEGMLARCLFSQVALSVVLRLQTVADCNIFVFHKSFCTFLILQR